VVFVTGDDEYSTELTMPIIAAELEASYGMRASILSAYPDPHADHIPGLELLEQADLMVLFLRNRMLPRDQVERIVGYLDDGNPLVSLRTSTHAFLYPDGHELEAFNDFGPRYVGAPYVWDYGHENGTDVRPAGTATDHPILTGAPAEFHVPSWLYTLLPNYPVAGSQILMTGFPVGDSFDPEAGDPVDTPVAWTRRTDAGGRVFTTTLGHPVDLQQEGLQRLIINGIHWALGLDVPSEWAGPLPMNVPYREE
jgi:type 1 glutamine amidotransferase